MVYGGDTFLQPGFDHPMLIFLLKMKIIRAEFFHPIVPFRVTALLPLMLFSDSVSRKSYDRDARNKGSLPSQAENEPSLYRHATQECLSKLKTQRHIPIKIFTDTIYIPFTQYASIKAKPQTALRLDRFNGLLRDLKTGRSRFFKKFSRSLNVKGAGRICCELNKRAESNPVCDLSHLIMPYPGSVR